MARAARLAPDRLGVRQPRWGSGAAGACRRVGGEAGSGRAELAGNDATEWGTAREDEAVEAYKRLTGADVSHMLFRVLSPDEAELWLGASPDRLVAGAATKDAESAESDDEKTASSSPPGVLEIKCPWNKGDPLNAVPYPRVPWYYVPQAQGLMAVFDRPYCDVFCYTRAQRRRHLPRAARRRVLDGYVRRPERLLVAARGAREARARGGGGPGEAQAGGDARADGGYEAVVKANRRERGAAAVLGGGDRRRAGEGARPFV